MSLKHRHRFPATFTREKLAEQDESSKVQIINSQVIFQLSVLSSIACLLQEKFCSGSARHSESKPEQ
jgi:hypothetical protein